MLCPRRLALNAKGDIIGPFCFMLLGGTEIGGTCIASGASWDDEAIEDLPPQIEPSASVAEVFLFLKIDFRKRKTRKTPIRRARTNVLVKRIVLFCDAMGRQSMNGNLTRNADGEV